MWLLYVTLLKFIVFEKFTQYIYVFRMIRRKVMLLEWFCNSDAVYFYEE